MIGNSCPTVPNPIYYCCVCNKNLKSRYWRFKNPHKAPAMYKVNDKVYCEKCFLKGIIE